VWRAKRVVIPRLRENPKIVVLYDAGIVGDLIAELSPILRQVFTKECEYRICELLVCRVISVVRDALVHHGP